MIDQIDERLSTWIEETLGGVKPLLTAPKEGDGALGVNLYLLELVDEPVLRHANRPPGQVALRYLVTTTADDPREAHRLLGLLVMAALDNPDFTVELTPLPAQTWVAFGVMPRPSFILRVPLPREWPQVDIPRVLQPPALDGVPLTTFYGVLLGPKEIPIAGARIELPALHRSTTTDARGRFLFRGIPEKAGVTQMVIKAKGRAIPMTIEVMGTEEKPVVIPFDPFEKEK